MFFVIEGIDGAGCGAQRKNIEKKLKEQKLDVLTMKFPYYENATGKILRQFLKEGRTLSLEMQFLLFAAQMVSEKEKIQKERMKKIIICDRYFSSTLVYQSLNGFDRQVSLEFAKNFRIEVPDCTFYLDTPPKVAKERKLKEEGKSALDIYEADFEFIKQVDKEYQKLIKGEIFTKWEVIDNTKSIDEVSDDIIKRIKKIISDENL